MLPDPEAGEVLPWAQIGRSEASKTAGAYPSGVNPGVPGPGGVPSAALARRTRVERAGHVCGDRLRRRRRGRIRSRGLRGKPLAGAFLAVLAAASREFRGALPGFVLHRLQGLGEGLAHVRDVLPLDQT